MDTPKTRNCDYCKKSYHPKTARSAYCSDPCRYAAHRAKSGAAVGNLALANERRTASRAARQSTRTCAICGEPFTVNGKQGRRKLCDKPECAQVRDNAQARAGYQRRKVRKAARTA